MKTSTSASTSASSTEFKPRFDTHPLPFSPGIVDAGDQMILPLGEKAAYPNDYCRTYYPLEGVAVGAYQAQCHKNGQEDRLRVSSLQGWEELSTEQQEEALFLTFAILEKHFGENEVGSTASVAIVSVAENKEEGRVLLRTTAHLADSPIYQSEDGETKLITRAHTGKDPEEKKRVASEGGEIWGGRLNGGLIPTRGFGDREHDGSAALYTRKMIRVTL